MIKIYIIFGSCLVLLGTYWAGHASGRASARADFAGQEQAASTALQNEITHIKGQINEETYHTASIDIRGRLRDKYTIKD